MSVRIIVDSTADVSVATKEKITTIPLMIVFGEETFLDGETITHQEFYERLIENDVLPHTSQASPHDFMKAYEEVKEAGDEAVVITISSKLSGTYQSAMIALEEYEDCIHVVDSYNAAIGSGILAEYALRLAEQGKTAEEIVTELEQIKDRVRVIALLDTLEYLKLGGRISKTAAFAGGLLNIKPVVAVRDGEVVAIGKARGSKQGNNLLISEIEKAGGVDFDMPLLLGYTGLDDGMLRKYIEDSRALWEQSKNELNITSIGSAIGTHIGPGAIAVAFFAQG